MTDTNNTLSRAELIAWLESETHARIFAEQQRDMAQKAAGAAIRENIELKQLVSDMECEIAGLNEMLDECDRAFETAGELLHTSTAPYLRNN